MKEIRLLKLTLQHFQGMTITVDVGGKDLMVFADNGIGKTRLFSAFTYLLFSKDSLGRSDFSIKDLDAEGNVAERGIDHIVSGDFDVNGDIIALKKVYREKWVKQRGRAESEFSGHTVDYFVNGVSVQEKIYKAKVEEIAGSEEIFKLTTSPSSFPALPWQKQRGILLEVVGDFSTEDVIASEPQLAKLPDILKGRSIDDHKAIVTSEKSKINKELEKIPVRIDECNRSIPDISGLDRARVDTDVISLETSLNAEKLKLQGINTGGKLADLTKKLAVIGADIQKMQDAHYQKTILSAGKLSQGIADLENKAKANSQRVSDIDSTIDRKRKRIAQIEESLIPLRKEWQEADAQVFAYFEYQDTTESVCPTCSQNLPADKVQAARDLALSQYNEAIDKALKKFNNGKATAIGEINQRGLNLKEESDTLLKDISTLEEEKATIATLEGAGSNLQDLITERDAIRKSAEDYSNIPRYTELLTQKAEVEALIAAEKEGKSEDAAIVQININTLQATLTEAKEYADRFVRRESGEKRINDLKAEEKKLATEYERLESELFLIDLFTKTKVALLTKRINNKFEMVQFILFEDQINGGTKDVCEIKMGGVGYNSGLNNAGRIQAGLDIVRTLQQHYKISAPVFIDNRESVVRIPKMDTQVISLLVSEPDKKLRIETGRGLTA